MPDERSRPTKPPPGSRPERHREEDAPLGQYRVQRPLGEPIAMVALRAPKPAASDPQEALLKALAATEGRMLLELSDQRDAEQERQALFEAQLRKEIQGLVIREMKSVPPPPHAPKSGRFEWTHLQYVAAVIVALTGLIALIINAQKPSAEVLKRFDAIDAAEARADKKLDAHVTAESAERAKDRLKDYEYQLDVRSWITDVLEKAASVKIDDPPGTPKRDQLLFYPPPRIDPHKVTGTHIVQPRDPYPVPPPP